MNTNGTEHKSMASKYDLASQKFFHGTKANLKHGALIEPGFNSNYGQQKKFLCLFYCHFECRNLGSRTRSGRWARQNLYSRTNRPF
jgi:hypothetical protein